MGLAESGEMYLETIYVLNKKSDSVRSIDVCEYMGYSKPSVSRAVGILKNDGYITVDKGGYIELTSSGRQIAKKIYVLFSKNMESLRTCLLADRHMSDEGLATQLRTEIKKSRLFFSKKIVDELLDLTIDFAYSSAEHISSTL